jgi:acyl-CoA thioester hydrolase
MKVHIYYHDTDSGGVVYYANYLKFFEEARTDFFASKGTPVKELAKKGLLFVVSRQEVDYKSPARYGDTLDVTCAIGAMTSVRIEFLHEVTNQDGKLIVQAKTIMVCVDPAIKPQAIPEELKTKWST